VKYLITLAVGIIGLAPTIHSSAATGPVITWHQVEARATGGQFPAWTSYMKPLYDAASGTTLWYNARSTSSIIYSTDIFSYKASTQTWTRLGGTGSSIGTCGDGSTATDVNGSARTPWPSDRHPIQQIAIDTTRNVLHLVNGVCANVVPYDHWAYALKSTPTSNTWSRLLAGVSNVPTVEVSGSMDYSPSHDVLVFHGTNSGNYPQTWVFCPGEGAPSATQQAVGCTARSTWVRAYAPTTTTDPVGSYFSSIIYEPVTNRVLNFAGPANVWSYDLAAKTWTNKRPANVPAEPDTWSAPERSVTRISSGVLSGKIYYRQTSHTTSNNSFGDYLYDPSTNAWTSLASTGTGPRQLVYVVFDPSAGTHGAIIAFSYDGGLWQGTIQADGALTVPAPSSPLNLRIVRGGV